jgi:hypothetical protein
MVATTMLVLVSMRETDLVAGSVCLVAGSRLPQFGTHTLPKPAASPEQGDCPTVTAITLSLFGSSRLTVFVLLLVTHWASSVETCQSGLPGTM